MKEIVINSLMKLTSLTKEEIEKSIEIPPSQDLGDYSFPCFVLARSMKKNPVDIAQELAHKIVSKDFEKVEAKGPYLNFFLNKGDVANNILNSIFTKKEEYGSSKEGKGKTVVIDMSSPNIAKPFGIGHLRSTIIGNSLSKIHNLMGYKTIKINYLGDWGTQFGKLITAYKHFGDAAKLKADPIKYLLQLYVKGNSPEFEDEARQWFKKLEDGDKEAIRLWKQFKTLSLKEFDKLYKLLNIKFDVVSGESYYNNMMDETVASLRQKALLVKSEGAEGVDLDKFGLGFCMITKSDGATLYATRDITAAIDRYNKYKFDKLIYEVGQEQKLHFQQVFKVLELMGNSWARHCTHVYHGLYLASDGKKFATREGKTVFMEDVFNEAISLAKEEIKKREKLDAKSLEKRATSIALAAIFYGDLKNYRSNDIVFDINRFISFEGDTGPYLLYTYARAKSILRKANYKKSKNLSTKNISKKEKELIVKMGHFPDSVKHACNNLSPNIIANYAFDLAQTFNEYYHSEQVIGSIEEQFRLSLVACFAQVLKNALDLLGIEVIEKM